MLYQNFMRKKNECEEHSANEETDVEKEMLLKPEKGNDFRTSRKRM